MLCQVSFLALKSISYVDIKCSCASLKVIYNGIHSKKRGCNDVQDWNEDFMGVG